MILRLLYRRAGGYVHCRVFSAPSPQANGVACGRLIFVEREWPSIRSCFEQGGAQVMEDPNDIQAGEAWAGWQPQRRS